MIEFADQQVFVFLAVAALHDIDMNVNHSLVADGDLAQLLKNVERRRRRE